MRFVLFFTLSFCVFAGDQLTNARLGYILDADGSLIAIDGVPGAARLSATPDTIRYRGLASASHTRLTITWTADTLTVCAAACRQLPLPLSPRAAAVSPSGAYLTVLSDTSLTTYSVSDLHPASVALAGIGLTSRATPALAISDAGTTLLGTPEGLLISPIHGHPVLAPTVLSFPRFLPHSPLAVAYAPTEHVVLLFNPSTLSTEQLLTAADGLTDPTAIEIATSGALWVSQSGATPLLSYSLVTHSAGAYNISPGTLRSLGTPAVYLWSDSALLDTSRGAPQVLVIAAETR